MEILFALGQSLTLGAVIVLYVGRVTQIVAGRDA